MGWGNVSVVPLVIIQSGQPNTGLFIYAVPPPLGPGNPPVFAVVAPGVTKDPYGNTVSAVLNIGNISAAHSGFDQNGIEYLSDASGTTKIVIDPARGMFFYSGTAALGNPPQLSLALSGVTADTFGNAIGTSKILVQANVITESSGIFRTAAAAPLLQLDGVHNAYLEYNAASGLSETIAPVGTSDGLGSTVLPGFATYTTTTPFIALQLQAAIIQWQSGAAQGGPWTADRSLIEDVSGNLQLLSGTRGGVSQAGWLLVSGATFAGTLAGSNGPVAINNTALPSNALTTNASILSANSGHLKVTSTATGGDGNTYGAERGLQQVSPRSQSITSTTGVNIGGLSWPVIAGTYIVRCRLVIEWNAAAGQPEIRFAGPAVSQMDVSFKSAQSGSAAYANANTNALVSAAAGNGTGYNGAFVNATGVMTAAGIFFDMDIWGMFTFTASGTLTLAAATTVAADPWIVFSGFWEVLPA